MNLDLDKIEKWYLNGEMSYSQYGKMIEEIKKLRNKLERIQRKCEVCGETPVKGFLYPEKENDEWLLHCLDCSISKKRKEIENPTFGL